MGKNLLHYLLKITVILLFVISCKKEEKPILPQISSTALSNISGTGAISGGVIILDGGAPIIAKGVCWDTSVNPTIANSKTMDGVGLGSFSSYITGLSESVTYHVRAYATNSVGTAYGQDLFFTTLTRPTLTTSIISNINLSSAISGGSITFDGGSPITARGVCWSTTENPTITNSKTIDATGTGSFNSNIIDLAEGTTFYVRAYATNSVGTSYGNQLSFTTNLKDIDGNIYHAITIGKQTWLVENLKVTHYRNGDDITYAGENILWSDYTTGLFCNYNDDLNNANVYGRLYNWYSINDGRKLCPAGWHVPTDVEWETLGTFLGGPAIAQGVLTLAGGKMKEVGITHWTINVGADNSSGFTALPGGRRFDDGTPFGNLGFDGFWWSATEVDSTHAFSRSIYGTADYMYRDNYYKKSWGFSVRCLKD